MISLGSTELVLLSSMLVGLVLVADAMLLVSLPPDDKTIDGVTRVVIVDVSPIWCSCCEAEDEERDRGGEPSEDDEDEKFNLTRISCLGIVVAADSSESPLLCCSSTTPPPSLFEAAATTTATGNGVMLRYCYGVRTVRSPAKIYPWQRVWVRSSAGTTKL